MTYTVTQNRKQVFSGKDYYIAHEVACRVSESTRQDTQLVKGCNCRIDCPHSKVISTYRNGRITV